MIATLGQTILVADVAIDARVGGGEALYTYQAPEEAQRGQVYFVPLAGRTVLGFVMAVRETAPSDLGFPVSRLRSLGNAVVGLCLPQQVVELIKIVAEETLSSVPAALSMASPPRALDRVVTSWRLTNRPDFDRSSLTVVQSEVLRVMEESGGEIHATRKKPLAASSKRALVHLRAKGLVEQTLALSPGGERRRLTGMMRLVSDAPRIERFLMKEGKRKPAHALTLMRLQGTESTSLSAQEIKALSGVTDQTIHSLLQSGLLEIVDEEAVVSQKPPEPNPWQVEAIRTICRSITKRESETFLLFGVTGSGKTEVYLRAAEEALNRGRQVLYLVPEIALTAQVIGQLRARFGKSVAVLHSNLAAGERLDHWMRIATGEAPVVLGARSALFAPLDNIGLIILDEEHEASYKQESTPRYHSKRLAQFLGRQHNAPVVLGSATPSVESVFESEQGLIQKLVLPHRAASAQMPTVHIEDLAAGYRAGKPSMFTERLHDAMVKTLERKEQIILFLNRRAYAPFLLCRDCGHQFVCPECSVSLSFHRRIERLKCHHCGFSRPAPETCPDCGGLRVSPFGAGSEKVEEAVAEFFPEATVARLDRDVAQRKGAVEQTLAQFRSGAVHILVGTQMVAKGLDFPNVTLVGVIAADISLNLPDFRSSERTFQLLSQVGGRAGRGLSPGQVIIQTFNPTHPAILFAQQHDYESFYESIIKEREEAGYPPFRRLANIVLASESRPEVEAYGKALFVVLEATIAEAEILGPVDCPLERLQGRWRKHFLLKFPADASPIALKSVPLLSGDKNVQVTVDVDPYSLM